MSIDFTKMSVADMRAELVRLTGANIADIEAIKGKSVLAERIIDERKRLGLEPQDDNIAQFGNVEMENASLIPDYGDDDDEEVEQREEVVLAPAMGSALWQDYVLEHLNDDEFVLKDGKRFPRAAGLRRVTQILCGDIVGSGPLREYVGNKNATVVYEVQIQWSQGVQLPEYLPEKTIAKLQLPVRRFTEIADCTPENTPHPYHLHAAATASTKAAGRVYKNILQLNCHTAEEMSLATEAALSNTDDVKSVEVAVGDMETETVSTVQKKIISQLGERLGIDIEKALKFHDYETDVSKLTRDEAKNFIVVLNKYQSDVANASMMIPEVIKLSLV